MRHLEVYSLLFIQSHSVQMLTKQTRYKKRVIQLIPIQIMSAMQHLNDLF